MRRSNVTVEETQTAFDSSNLVVMFSELNVEVSALVETGLLDAVTGSAFVVSVVELADDGKMIFVVVVGWSQGEATAGEIVIAFRYKFTRLVVSVFVQDRFHESPDPDPGLEVVSPFRPRDHDASDVIVARETVVPDAHPFEDVPGLDRSRVAEIIIFVVTVVTVLVSVADQKIGDALLFVASALIRSLRAVRILEVVDAGKEFVKETSRMDFLRLVEFCLNPVQFLLETYDAQSIRGQSRIHDPSEDSAAAGIAVPRFIGQDQPRDHQGGQ